MLKKKLKTILESKDFKKLLKTYHVKRIAIFGSYAKGTAKRKSDIDFLVEFRKGADLLDQVGLKLDLEKIFKMDVDVVTPKALSRYIRKDVLKKAVFL